jgi:SAM-dependent methyltransferase
VSLGAAPPARAAQNVSGRHQRLAYSKLCALADFASPELGELIRRLFPTEAARDARFPSGAEHRKQWELAQAVRALRDLGAVREDAEILGVGAGHEPTIFYLTNHVRRVFATDLYAARSSWREAPEAMLRDPGAYTDLAWNPRRLVVQHADALALPYEDATFDGVFSAGSIEHFGDDHEIAYAASEMCRVLKPGGVAAIATEYRLAGPSPGFRQTRLFDREELERVIVRAAPWDLAGGFDPQEPESAAVSFVGCAVDHSLSRLGITRTPRLPHIVLRYRGFRFTSASLALVKRAS